MIAWRMKDYGNYDKSSFHSFIAILAGLGVFVTFMFYYNVVELQNQQQLSTGIQEIARINNSISNSLLEEIKNSSLIIPNFVLSITPLTNTACCNTQGCLNTSIPEDPVTPETCTQKMVLSYKIFSLWQDQLVSNKYVHLDEIPYVSNFLQRANSKQLYEQWLVNKLNFSEETQNFGDLLFKYGLPITVQVPDSYITAAKELINDVQYQSILSLDIQNFLK